MKKTIALVLSVVLICTLLSSCEFSSMKSLKLPFSSKQFDFETIDWNVKTTDIDKDYDKEMVDKISTFKTNPYETLSSSGESSESYKYTVTTEYEGVKNVTETPVKVLYSFDSDELLKNVMFSISGDYPDALVNLKDIAKTVVTDYDDKNMAGYFMNIGGNSVEVIVNKDDRAILITCLKSGFVTSASTQESTFKINDIDWNMTRDEIAMLHSNKFCRYNEPKEEYAPLGYSFVNLDGIARNDISLNYYFNEDNTIKNIVIYMANTDSNWQNALKYFGQDVNSEKKMTTVETANSRAVLDIDEDLDSILIFAVANN